MVSPTIQRTAKSVNNSNGVTTQMVMWKHIAIFYEEKCIQGGYEIYLYLEHSMIHRKISNIN